MPIQFDKYEKSSDYHWRDFEDVNSHYHKHAKFVAQWIEPGYILDVGCGDGLITHLLGAHGIDSSETGIRLAQEHGVDAEVGDAYDLSKFYGQYNSVYMGDIIEHLDDPTKAIQEAMRVAPNIYIATPPYNGIAYNDYHVKEWTQEELRVYLESLGLHLWPIETANVRMYARCLYTPQ